VSNWDNRIQELCMKAVQASPSDVEPILAELKVAIHEYVEQLRMQTTAAHLLFKKEEAA
jgi:hypothetical protein